MAAGCPERDDFPVSEQRYGELADFLRTRRAALTPEQMGVPTTDTPRRVPGLRREEVALLAGVSVNYYTRIEQGESHQMSEAVIESIASALRLDDSERLHLLRLARPEQMIRRSRDPEQVRRSMLALAESNTEQAVVIAGRQMDLLGASRLGIALYGLRPDQRPNLARMMFLEPAMRDLLVHWERDARRVVSYLRMATGGHQNDPQLAELIGELSIKSPEFAAFWATYPVADCTFDVREFNHPVVGRLVLNEESLAFPDSSGRQMIFLGADPGSASADRLRMLDSLVS
jgi:transcriptional regulator with XRE-family HTH domain